VITIPEPMLPREGATPFTDAAWIYEVKYDGYRCMARLGGGAPIELRTKSGIDCTAWFPEITEVLGMLPGGPHIIDGQACVLDQAGRSDFTRMRGRARRRQRVPGSDQVTFCAFDLLYMDGRDVMSLPLVKRKAMLRQLLNPVKDLLVIVSDFPAEVDLFESVVLGSKGGFVARRMASPYVPGVISADWRNVKRAGWQKGGIWPEPDISAAAPSRCT
jgi:bifunctional non-homologous end joining protein LigD